MGIWKRIKNMTVAEMNGWLDQAENPVRMLNHYLREMDEQLAKGQEALASQLFLEKKQMRLIAQTKEAIAKRLRQAQLAVDRDEQDIARMALQEKLLQEKKLEAYEEQLAAITNQTLLLQQKLSLLQAKAERYNHRRILLLSRANVAQTIRQIQQTSFSFSTENVAKGFARAEEQVLLLEAQVEAGSQLTPPCKPQAVFALDPALQDDVERELATLKKTEQETATQPE